MLVLTEKTGQTVYWGTTRLNMGKKSTTPQLSASQKNIWLSLTKRRDSAQHLVQRVRIVLLAAAGHPTHTVSVDEKTGIQALEEMWTRVLSFVEYFNETLAKPFRWTFTGTPLKKYAQYQVGWTSIGYGYMSPGFLLLLAGRTYESNGPSKAFQIGGTGGFVGKHFHEITVNRRKNRRFI